ncbi:MAG TPA: DUF2723 domain-containing protein [bacterium]|nr:DUF2723 domain-containing protein [bacterium]
MKKNKGKENEPGVRFWVFPLLFFIPYFVYLRTLCPAFLDDDSPETITAGVTLGIQHPPGYPLAALVAHLAGWLPLGSEAFRVNFLSALLGALAAVLLASLILRLLEGFFPAPLLSKSLSVPEKTMVLTAFVAALLLAFSRSFWEKSLGAKGGIYLLETLLLLGLLRCALEWERAPRRRWLVLALFFLGLGLAHHWQTQVLFLPVLAVFFVREEGDAVGFDFPGWKNALLASGLLGVGLSPLLYLPLRAHFHPALNLGAPDSFPHFMAELTRKYYRERETGLLRSFLQALVGWTSWDSFLTQARQLTENQANLIWKHLGGDMKPPALLLALLGLWGWRRFLEKKFLLFLLIPLFLLVMALYLIPTPANLGWYLDNFLIPVNWIVALLAGVGFYFLFTLEGFTGKKLGRVLLLLVWSALPLLPLTANFQWLDERHQVARYDYGVNLLKSLPRGSLFLAEGDEDDFPLYYLQQVQGRRPDVRMVPAFTLFEDWGEEQVERLYPEWGLSSSTRFFHDPITRIHDSLPELVQKSSGWVPRGFSRLDGAFHRYYLASHPGLTLRPSGTVLMMADDLALKAPALSPRGLRLRHLEDCLSNYHPSLMGIWGVYASLGLFQDAPLQGKPGEP